MPDRGTYLAKNRAKIIGKLNRQRTYARPCPNL